METDTVEVARWLVDRALAEAWNAGNQGLEREAIWAGFDKATDALIEAAEQRGREQGIYDAVAGFAPIKFELEMQRDAVMEEMKLLRLLENSGPGVLVKCCDMLTPMCEHMLDNLKEQEQWWEERGKAGRALDALRARHYFAQAALDATQKSVVE